MKDNDTRIRADRRRIASNQKMLKKQMQTHPKRGRIAGRFPCAVIPVGQRSRHRKKRDGKSKQAGVQNHPKSNAIVRRSRLQTRAKMMRMIAIASGIIAPGSFIVGKITAGNITATAGKITAGMIAAGMIAVGMVMSGCVILLFRVAGTGCYGQQGIMRNRSHIILDGTRHILDGTRHCATKQTPAQQVVRENRNDSDQACDVEQHGILPKIYLSQLKNPPQCFVGVRFPTG